MKNRSRLKTLNDGSTALKEVDLRSEYESNFKSKEGVEFLDEKRRAVSTGRIRQSKKSQEVDSQTVEQKQLKILEKQQNIARTDVKPRAVSADRLSPRPAPTSGGMSNYQQIKNAITHVCLAGSHFEAARIEALNVVDQYHRGKATAGEVNMNLVNLIS